mgnify:CR=1 FL=1|tara:strand:+ start:279 stop:572 length:294 start_codon:yes stop_codon:yes gene_type:complete
MPINNEPEIVQEITQELVNNTFIEMSEMWIDAFEASEHRLVASFVAENKDGWAVQFLAHYQMAKESVESLGLFMPVLVEGITINLTAGGENADQETH